MKVSESLCFSQVLNSTSNNHIQQKTSSEHLLCTNQMHECFLALPCPWIAAEAHLICNGLYLVLTTMHPLLLNSLHVLPHLILKTTLGRKYHFVTPFYRYGNQKHREVNLIKVK